MCALTFKVVHSAEKKKPIVHITRKSSRSQVFNRQHTKDGSTKIFFWKKKMQFMNKRPLFDTHRYLSAPDICTFLESGERSVFYDHTKCEPPTKMTGIDEIDRRNRDANIPRTKHVGWKPSPLAVGVGVCVYDISDIDASSGHFFGHFRLMLKWLVPDLSNILKEVGITRSEDRTPIPLTFDEFKYLAASSATVDGYQSFAKTLSVPSFALNTLGGDPVITQRYAYVAESTDIPEVVTMQIVLHGKFKMMKGPIEYRKYPMDSVELDFKIRLWDNRRDGARYFEPLRFPDGTHFLFPLKMNVSLPDWNLFSPVLRLYRQGGMKGENAKGPSVFAMSLVAKRKPFRAFAKVLLFDTIFMTGLSYVTLGNLLPNSPIRDASIMLLCGMKMVHSFSVFSPKFETPLVDSHTFISMGLTVMASVKASGGHSTICNFGAELIPLWVAIDLISLSTLAALEYSQVTSKARLAESTWRQEMGDDFNSKKVSFE